MRLRLLWFLAAPAVACCLGAPALADEGKAEDKESIAKQGEAFVEAFHKGDAAAVAAFWTADGDYTDRTGRRLKGREAIEKAFQHFFADNKSAKVRINSDSLRFVTPDVAVEDGTTEVFPAAGGPPSQARYTIVHVKKDGQWLLSSVRDAPVTPPGNAEHLRVLEWAVGDWAGDTDTGEGERLAISWAENENFLVATFTTTARDVRVGSATQWIGWDPLAKRVRSWIFDDTGGFGDGTWTRDGKKWVVKTTSVLQSGKKATATFVLGHVDADTITLRSRERTVDGKELPDTREIKLKRVK